VKRARGGRRRRLNLARRGLERHPEGLKADTMGSLPVMHFVSLPSVFALIAVVAAFVAGCGSSSSSKVSAGSYVSAVCSAITPLEQDVVSRSSELNNSTATNAAQAKKTLKSFLTAVAQDSDNALSKIEAAGTPDIDNGKTVAGTIVQAFTQLRNAMRNAETKASVLPTGSSAAFKSGAQALGNSVRSALNNIDASGLRNRDLEQAASSQQACKKLNSG
jgi:hypothetical protein